ncbi:hypothetical protein [Paenibacillus segetis]|uniref:Uncharacterized protein n=1 Tax=Paenibacillus segetis TaxID=1325360 RepID=A0ABQ1YGF1_9BACL|nr:hypothetical protein [Paenibacillus segetis]GGH23741.1 hypothetical protein GCM10008013_23070 [Paenibacillus segetis]
MFMIGLTFALVMLFEWNKMRKQNKDKRTILIVQGISLFFFILLEVLYAFQYNYTIPIILNICIEQIHAWMRGK